MKNFEKTLFKFISSNQDAMEYLHTAQSSFFEDVLNQYKLNSIEDIKDMSSKKQKEFNEYINQQAQKRVERDYKKVNKDWRDEISPSEFLVRVAKEEKIIKNKAKKRGINVALGLTGLSLLRPRALFKQLIGDDEDIDDTEV